MELSPSVCWLHGRGPASLLVGSLLEESGFATTMWGQVASFLEWAEGMPVSVRPDLLLIELDLPDGDGFDVWQRVSGWSAWEGVPCVFLSERDEPIQRLEAIAVGALDCIHPPVSVEWLPHQLQLWARPAREELALDALVPGMVINGRYGLIRELGRGGMSTVWLVDDQLEQAECALKFFRPTGHESSEAQRKRFLLEMRIQLSLEHDQLMPVWDMGSWRGTLYYTMMYVPGGSLSNMLAQGPIDVLEALRLTIALSSVVQVLHEHHYLHRDLKPDNILFDALGAPYLTDFGVAFLERAETRITHQEIVLGTPGYMAPERLTMEEEVDARSDLYSLGLLLYVMLAGKLPYEPEDLVSMHRTMMAGLPPLSLSNPDIPTVIWEICQKATAYHPEERYRSASEFRKALIVALQRLGRRERALIVDDDPMIQQVLVPQLEQLGIECLVVDTTASALEQVCVGRPDIALIRSDLPELDCDVLLRCIRKFPGLSLLPVVMVQESWDEESLQLAERSSVEHRLTKPFRLREVSGNILRMASRFRKSARPSMALRPGLVLKDRFLLREPVHQSRHHVIYEAFDQREKQVVACKALRPDAMAEPKAVERFSCEVRALKKLSHPSILPLLDDGVEPVTRIPFFLMPYWPHGTLADRLEQEGALPLAEAIVLTGKLADALEAMHERELLHCDVKASNVLLTEDGEPILADFGFALHMREKHLWPDVPAGTPSAMAPEQFSVPPDLDGRSDLFSLGLLFVELATGEHLLASLPIHDIHHQVTTSDLRRSSLVQERIPAFARELCMRSLARHREERFPSAYAMAQACRAVLGTMKNRADFVS